MEEDAEDYTSKHPEGLLWLLELAYHKTEYTAHLKTLFMLEAYNSRYARTKHWTPPQTLANSLHEFNIEFTGTVGILLTFMR
jgi:hypothetical protein